MRAIHWSVVLLATVSCEQGAPTAPLVQERVVVHAVLDPQLTEQVVLVERTQNGATPSGTAAKNASELTVSSADADGARVVLYGPAADSIVAVEDPSCRTNGTAVFTATRKPHRAQQRQHLHRQECCGCHRE
ncbi:MAG: hypothetical protein U0132_19160 [Gemmatimonadaceae bacterium]